MNGMSEYLNLSFSFEFVLFLCFRIFPAFLCPCVPYGLACLVFPASILPLENAFSLDVFCHIITLSMFELWFFSLIAGGIPDLPPLFCVGFGQNWFLALSINITWVMKRFQDNAFNLVMQIKQTAQMHLKIIKETTGECQGKKVFVFISFGWNRDNSDRTMNTRSNSCQQTTSSIPTEPSSWCL